MSSNNDYLRDRHWADGYTPAIKQIIGPLLLIETPNDIDCREAADLMLFTAKNVKIGARVRERGVFESWPYQFTIRYARSSGVETEFSKIRKGYCDWLFYGHRGVESGSIERWFIINLDSFRVHLDNVDREWGTSTPIRHGIEPNRDGDKTWFIWFDLRTFPPHPPILVASSHPMPTADNIFMLSSQH